MPKTKTRFTLDSFNTRTKSETGEKFPLFLPDGTPTEEFLIIRGQDCNDFRKAQASMLQKRLEFLQKNTDKAAVRLNDLQLQREMLAVLVAGWSFEEPCTPQSVIQMFEDAPQILDQVENISGDRTNFFTKPGSNS